MSNLKMKTVRGSMITAAALLGIRPITMIFDIILLRLLVPEVFGLIALGMILINMTNLFTDLGMRQAIVQTRHDIKKVTQYAFIIVITGSVLVNLLVILFAPPLARLLGGGQPLVPVIIALSFIITIDGLWVVPDGILRRNLRFKEMALAQFVSDLIGSLTSIILAYLGFGVWSLVIGSITGKSLRGLLLWFYARPWFWLRPQGWDREVAESVVRFGVPTTGSGMLRYFSTQWDTWFVGRTLGLTAVSFYSRAFDLTTRISDILTNTLFGQVLFPSYARLQDDRPRLARAYLKSTSLVLMLMVPVSLGLLVTAPLLVPVLLGDQWRPMIPVWQIFCVYGLTRPISTNSSPLFLAAGKPKNNVTASLVVIGVMVPLVVLLIGPYGILGAATGVVVAYTVAMFFNIYQAERLLPGSARKTLFQSLPFLLAGGLMSAAILLAWDAVIALTGDENALALILLIALGALTYLAVVLVVQRPLIVELYELTISALGLDRRWPRLAARRPRPTE
jgi:O-antigen/teichoic acid export membrane protein